MTSLTKGDWQVPGFPEGDEPVFRARERFIDELRLSAPEAIRLFRVGTEPTIEEVFEKHVDRRALERLLEAHGIQWGWPPKADNPPTYGDAFLGWPPPIRTSAAIGVSRIGDEVRLLYCWRFHGWILPTLLADTLNAWSRDPNGDRKPDDARQRLEDNPWVASHLLAQACRAHFAEVGSVTIENSPDPRVFPSPGVLAVFQTFLDESFEWFGQWDPTQERWGEWRTEAMRRIRKALGEYRAAVEKEAEARGLKRTSRPTNLERDLRRVVQFQVLGWTQERILDEEGVSDVKGIQSSIRRTAGLLNLKLRTEEQ